MEALFLIMGFYLRKYKAYMAFLLLTVDLVIF